MASTSIPLSKPLALGYLPLVLALGVLLVPTIVRLTKEVWPLDEQAHGPIIVLVVLYLLWQQRGILAEEFTGGLLLRVVGWSLLAIGSAVFLVGRMQEIIFFEVGGQIACLGALAIILFGRTGLRQLWFPILFLVFMLPLPGFVVDQLTGSLKLVVSEAAASLMHWAGLPIARDGVLLQIGQYKLLVADACSGLYSLISLTALGILYLWLIRSSNRLRNAILFASIFPIAIAANILRVIFLSLVTYYFGDEAGQGFLHGFAGMSLFLAALTMIISLDGILRLFMPDSPKLALGKKI